MRASLSAAPLFFLCACATPSVPDDATALMDEVERSIRLPAGSEPLDAYARHYSFGPRGEIVARYIIPSEPPDPSWTCSQLSDDLNSSVDIPCEPFVPDPVGAGQRRWVPDRRGLPMQFDGGCSFIRIRYDPKAHRVKEVFCNGYA